MTHALPCINEMRAVTDVTDRAYSSATILCLFVANPLLAW
jgi:hypothetical protein